MTAKNQTMKERTQRIKNFKRVLTQIIEARKDTIKMRWFTITEDEDRTLESMTVRALADAPEGSQAYFDINGVYIGIDGDLLETKDFVIQETSTPSSPSYADPFAIDSWDI